MSFKDVPKDDIMDNMTSIKNGPSVVMPMGTS